MITLMEASAVSSEKETSSMVCELLAVPSSITLGATDSVGAGFGGGLTWLARILSIIVAILACA